MVDAQPWWVIDQLPTVARAFAEVERAQIERGQAKS